MSFYHSTIFQNNELNNSGKVWTSQQIPTKMVLENSCTNKPTPRISLCNDKSKLSGSSKMKYECLDCEVFKRKIKENEQTVSSRDVLIEMLQSEIQKIQNLYKNSIDDYEKLRFIHCSTVHDFSSLKEIYRKIEAENRRLLDEKASLSTQLSALESLQKQLKLYPKEFSLRNGQSNASKDFAFIENIMQTQNQSLKLLLSNFLEDLKGSKSEGHADKSCLAICTVVETEDPVVETNIQKEVEALRLENQKIRENLNAKQEHLSKCLEVLEKNHLDIGNLSTHIENICCERDKCIKSLTDKDEEIAKLKGELLKTSPEIDNLRVEKERYRQENSKLRQVLDTYRSENEKKNSIIENHEDDKEQLHKELGKYKRLSEQLQGSTKDNAFYLEKLSNDNKAYKKEIEELKIKIQELSSTINERKVPCSSLLNEKEGLPENEKKAGDSDLQSLQEKNKQLVEELETVREHYKKCYPEKEARQIELTNKNLRETLDLLTAENEGNIKAKNELKEEVKQLRNTMQECEEKAASFEKEIENYKSLQTIEINNDAAKKKNHCHCSCSCSQLAGEDHQNTNPEDISSLKHDLEQANLEITEYEEENKCLRQKLDTAQNMITEAEEEIAKLRQCYKECEDRQNKMRQEFSELATEKDGTIKRLKNDIERLARQKSEQAEKDKMTADLKAETMRLEKENEMLRQQLVELENELSVASTQTEERAHELEKRIEMLEKQDEEKQKRLENCCHEMDKIQVSLNTEEHQKEQIDNDILTLKNINIAQAKEIDSLKDSIEHYKSLVDRCDCMDLESDCRIEKLEKLNEQLTDRIRNLEGQLCDKQCVINKLEECLDSSNKILADCEDELKFIHQENERLKNDLEVLRNNLTDQANKFDKEAWAEKMIETKRKSEELEKENVRLLSKNNDQKVIDDKITRLQEEYNKLLQESKAKDIELEKLTKQLQEYFLQPSTNQEDSLKLKSAPRKINPAEPPVDSKDEVLKCLQCKNNELIEEVGDLKKFVDKVVSDNNSMKQAITSLLNTVMNKIKILSGEDLEIPFTANDNAEEAVLSHPQNKEDASKKNGAEILTTSKCNCMEIIKSKYDVMKPTSMGTCEPCGGACNRIMEEKNNEIIKDAEEVEQYGQPTSGKNVPSYSSCCEDALKTCCKRP